MSPAGGLVVLDLEFTAWDGSLARRWTGPGEYREIVQIGAVTLAAEPGFPEIGALERLVRPRINPILSRYFIDLTRISQDQVDDRGVAFPVALDEFAAFIASCPVIVSNGEDFDVIAENCRLCGLDFPFAPDRFLNISPVLAKLCGVGHHVGSGELPGILPDVPQLGAHNALADARMVAQALRHFWAGGIDLRGAVPMRNADRPAAWTGGPSTVFSVRTAHRSVDNARPKSDGNPMEGA